MRNERLTSRIRYQKYVCSKMMEIRLSLLNSSNISPPRQIRVLSSVARRAKLIRRYTDIEFESASADISIPVNGAFCTPSGKLERTMLPETRSPFEIARSNCKKWLGDRMWTMDEHRTNLRSRRSNMCWRSSNARAGCGRMHCKPASSDIDSVSKELSSFGPCSWRRGTGCELGTKTGGVTWLGACVNTSEFEEA